MLGIAKDIVLTTKEEDKMAEKVDKPKPVILLLGPDTYKVCFTEFGDVLDGWGNPSVDVEKLLPQADVVVFTGGHDVSPELYGEAPHKQTYNNLQRDIAEGKVFSYCVENNIPMAGICRGSQFLTVMNGGKMIQHVDNHAKGGTHLMMVKKEVSTVTKYSRMQVTSTHHQMMYPWVLPKDDFKIIGYACSLAKIYEGLPKIEKELKHLTGTDFKQEPEVVWYPHTKSLAVQYHPEMMDITSDGFKYYQELLKEYIFNEELFAV